MVEVLLGDHEDGGGNKAQILQAVLVVLLLQYHFLILKLSFSFIIYFRAGVYIIQNTMVVVSGE